MYIDIYSNTKIIFNTQNVKNKNDNEVQSMFYSTLGADSVVREALKSGTEVWEVRKTNENRKNIV